MTSNQTYLYCSNYPSKNPFTLYVEAHTPDDDQTVTGLARLTSSYVSFSDFSGRYLELYIDGELVAQKAVSSLSAGDSVEIEGQLDCDDGTIDITAKWTGPKGTYCPGPGSVTCEKTVSTNYASSISLGSSSIELDNSVSYTINGKSGNTHTIYGAIGNSGWKQLASGVGVGSGNITIPASTFEPYMTSMTSGTMSIRCVTDNVGSNDTSLTVKVPDSYVPVIELDDIVYYNTANDYLIAQQSSFDIKYDTSLSPSNNSATIASVVITKAAYNPTSIGTPAFSIDTTNKKVSSGTLPAASGVSNYKVYVTLTATDTRGRKAVLNVTEDQIGTVYGYIPPAISNFEIFRCDASGNQSPSGQYAYVSVDIDSSTSLTICKVNINGVDYNLSKESTWYSAITGANALEKNTQYTATLTVQNTMMQSFGDVITQTAILPTMQMPISFYDDGSQMGVSIGEMARKYDDCDDDASVFNLSSAAIIRATSPEGKVLKKTGYDLLNDCPFPVGGIYMSVDSTAPATLWPGTTWVQIQNTFLLACGSSYSAGATGGEAEHTISVDEMPSHNHSHTLSVGSGGSHSHSYKLASYYTVKSGTGAYVSDAVDGSYGSDPSVSFDTGDAGSHSHTLSGSISNKGGGKAHNNMPPYLAVYMYKRTA